MQYKIIAYKVCRYFTDFDCCGMHASASCSIEFEISTTVKSIGMGWAMPCLCQKFSNKKLSAYLCNAKVSQYTKRYKLHWDFMKGQQSWNTVLTQVKL